MNSKEIKQVLVISDLLLDRTTPEVLLWKFEERFLEAGKKCLKYLSNLKIEIKSVENTQ